MTDDRTPRIITPIPQPLLERIDDYRFAHRLASRAEAIRRLLELALDAADSPPPVRGKKTF